MQREGAFVRLAVQSTVLVFWCVLGVMYAAALARLSVSSCLFWVTLRRSSIKAIYALMRFKECIEMSFIWSTSVDSMLWYYVKVEKRLGFGSRCNGYICLRTQCLVDWGEVVGR